MDLNLWKPTYWSFEHPNRGCRRVNGIPRFVCIFGKRILVACDPVEKRNWKRIGYRDNRGDTPVSIPSVWIIRFFDFDIYLLNMGVE